LFLTGEERRHKSPAKEGDMKTRSLLAFLASIAVVAAASAQTKTSGTIQCAKADPMHVVEVGDHPGHAFIVAKVACTWSKPMEIAGIQTKEGGSVSSEEKSGNKSSGAGVHWTAMANGDKIFVRFHGKTAYDKDGKVTTADGAWSYTGGTGKMKGIKGKGTYKGKGNPDGSMTYEVEGDYTLP
jgi:hypothetical protein